jgi:PBP1b-binding outer membrane lipoprotein LpoB
MRILTLNTKEAETETLDDFQLLLTKPVGEVISDPKVENHDPNADRHRFIVNKVILVDEADKEVMKAKSLFAIELMRKDARFKKSDLNRAENLVRIH